MFAIVLKSRERASRVRFAHEKTKAKIGTDKSFRVCPIFRVPPPPSLFSLFLSLFSLLLSLPLSLLSPLPALPKDGSSRRKWSLSPFFPSALWVVCKSREGASRVRFAHEKTKAKIGTDKSFRVCPIFRVPPSPSLFSLLFQLFPRTALSTYRKFIGSLSEMKYNLSTENREGYSS
jgi:hypothetical protein